MQNRFSLQVALRSFVVRCVDNDGYPLLFRRSAGGGILHLFLQTLLHVSLGVCRGAAFDRRYPPGVMPTRRLQYLQKNEGLGKQRSSAILATGLSVCSSSTLARMISARSIHSLALTPLVWLTTLLR